MKEIQHEISAIDQELVRPGFIVQGAPLRACMTWEEAPPLLERPVLTSAGAACSAALDPPDASLLWSLPFHGDSSTQLELDPWIAAAWSAQQQWSRPCVKRSADAARRVVSPGQGEDAHNRRGAGVGAGAGQAAARRDQRGQVHPLRYGKALISLGPARRRRSSGGAVGEQAADRRRIGRHQRQAVGRRQPRLPAAAQPPRARSQPRLLAAASQASGWRAPVTRTPMQPGETQAILHWNLESRPCRAAVHCAGKQHF